MTADAVIFTDGMTTTGVWARSAGPYRIATHLRRMGLRVQVVDFWSLIVNEGPELIDVIIEKFVGPNTLFVGFSSTFFNLRLQMYLGHKNKDKSVGYYTRHVDNQNVFCAPEDLIAYIRNKVKSINPNCAMLLGGARADKNSKHMDVVVFGYAEKELEEYIRWRQGKNPFFQSVKHDGKLIIENNVTAEGLDFTSATIDWEPEDCIIPGESLPIEVSRGCIFRCKFCSFPLNGRAKDDKDHLKDASILYDEFMRNWQLYGVRRYMFSDDTYNDSVSKMEQMNDIVQKLPFKLEFATYGRLDLIARFPEHIDLIEQNGCTSITFGIESLNQKSAASIGKGGKSERLIETLHELRARWKNRIHTSAGFIFGLPHDTYDTIDKWSEPVTDVRFPLHSPIFIPLGIDNTLTTQRKFQSDLDKDPGAFGYRLIENGMWVNDKFGTTKLKCEEIAHKMNNYITKQGRDHYGSHVLIGVENENLSRDQSLLLGAYGVNSQRNNMSHTYSCFLQYIGRVLNLEK
jgi:hypothetical protein